MSRLILVCLLSGGLSIMLAGQNTRLDSLLSAAESATDLRLKAELLNQLAFDLSHSDPSRAYDFADQAFVIAHENNFLKEERIALTLRGFYFFNKGEFRQALSLYQRGARVPDKADPYLAYNYILTGNLYRSIAEYDSSEQLYLKGIAILEKSESQEFLAYAHRNLGRLYVLQWRNAEAGKHFRKAEEIYIRSGSRLGQSEIYLALADLNKNLGDYQRAETYINHGCEIAEGIDDQYLKMQCRIARAEIQHKLGDFISSLETYLQVLDELNERDEPRTLLRVFSGLGDVYEVLSQNDLALRYYLEGLKISERLGMKHETGKVYSNIAWIYKNQRNFSPAFEFIEKSLQIREEIDDAFGVSNAYNVKGVIFMQQKKYPEAVQWINKALEIRRKIGFREGVAACYYNLGMVYEEQKNYQQALAYQMKAFEYEKSTGNKFTIGIAFSSIGSVYTYLSQFDSARYYLEKADELGIQTGSLELQMENSFYWSEFYEYQGRFKEALEWHKRYTTLNDSVYHETSASRLAEMQALYQTDQKDKAITVLNQEKMLQKNQLELQKAQISLQSYVILFVIVALVLVSLLAYKTWKYNRTMKQAHQEIILRKEELQAQSKELRHAYETIAKSNKELEAKVAERTSALTEAYRELDTFFYRASHDFRRPLTTFLGLAEVAKITITDENARELFNKVRETAVNLDKMLLKLQSISDLGSRQLAYGEVNVGELFQRALDQFSSQLKEKNIHTAITCVIPERFESYPEMLYIILENLVENSIAFCRYQGAFIRLKAVVSDGRVVIEVEDNGDGIEGKFHNLIFDMYFRGNDRSKGNGLGLYIIRKALEKLDGAIAFTSERDRGTHFVLSFPLTLNPAMEREGELYRKDAFVIS